MKELLYLTIFVGVFFIAVPAEAQVQMWNTSPANQYQPYTGSGPQAVPFTGNNGEIGTQAFNFSPGSGGTFGPIKTLVRSVGEILNALIPILIVLALLFFFWGLIQYVRKPEIKEGRKVMIAGIVALFIMVSIWGIVRLVQTSLGVTENSSIPPPQVPPYR